MKTKEESKGQSQYHFCDSTLNTFVNFFEQLQISSVLCIGCPRLHEHVLTNHKKIKSMLLDIDDRYVCIFIHFLNFQYIQLESFYRYMIHFAGAFLQFSSVSTIQYVQLSLFRFRRVEERGIVS